jgi:hypothetical protein
MTLYIETVQIANDRFMDPKLPKNKRNIAVDEPDRRRICFSRLTVGTGATVTHSARRIAA